MPHRAPVAGYIRRRGGSLSTEADFEIGDNVHIKSVSSQRLIGPVVDRYLDDDGEWFYSLDKRNYLHEDMLERA